MAIHVDKDHLDYSREEWTPGSPSNDSHIESHDTTATHSQDSNPQPRESELPVVNNVFYNEETLQYMEIIDMYRKLGIGKDIELPRLVIAGAQSCGKSSLLENLTGLPVPITTGIGTRFPIEITLIEDPAKSQTKPSIILDPKARDLSIIDKDKVQKFNLGQVYHDPMTQREFENLLREASDILGVPPPVFAGEQASGLKTTEASCQISSHVLQIEMRGKDFKSLSFVDTPGLYHAGNSEQDVTSVGDIEKLVTSLIEEKRTLIVAVMEATQSTVGQKIFKFADDVDTTGERTIGVLTKCDLAVTSDTDAFEATLRRARNQERKLTHGWYVVKNRSSTETKANISLGAARIKEANLFAQNEWHPSSSGIQCDRMGIMSLRTGLSNVFCAHIRAEFPAFNQQTRSILGQKRDQLAALGQARSRPKEQRDYLMSIVDAYQQPKARCLTEDYRTSTDANTGSISLQRLLDIEKRKNFRNPLKYVGATYAFRTPVGDRYDMSDDLFCNKQNNHNVYTWINHRYQETKSSALPGLVPHVLVERLFEEQTANWNDLTDKFVDSVSSIFLSAAEYCLRQACTNETICSALRGLTCKEIRVKMDTFRKSCYSLIQSERKRMQVVACEEQFVNEIKEARILRIISALAKLEQEPFFQTRTPSPFGDLRSTTPSTSSGFGGGFGQSTSSATSGTSVPVTTAGGLFGSLNASSSTSDTSVPATTVGGLFGTGETSSTTTTTGGLFGSLNASSVTSGAPVPVTSSIFGAKTEVTQTTFKSVAEFAKTNKSKLRDVLTDDRQLVYEIHDILKAYYNISVQNYIDRVCKNLLDDEFIYDTINLFSKGFVDGLSDSEINAIAAESATDRKQRRELKEDIEKLEMAISQSEAILNKPLAED